MNSEDKSTNWFNAWRLALTLGIVWGLGLGILGAVTVYTEVYGHRLVEVAGSIYWGYDSTWLGALIGTGWGFLDAFVGTLIAAWLYRCLACCCARSEPPATAPQG
ncbi:MAG TPA: hypothetical protein VNA25_04420 [Phycisphaerae bacterium]|nr:hypothetical protein [Phycisphaerae bacterium]